MKKKSLELVFVLLCAMSWAQGPLTAAALESAVQEQACAKIASQLAQTPLHSEGMKYNGAICLYRNGEVERAMALFQVVRAMEAEKQHLASFWEGKCHAKLGEDSLAMACLNAIPAGVLNLKMLSQKEFGHLAETSGAFQQLKKTVEPGFNAWTALLGAVALLGLLLALVLWFGKSRFSEGEKWLSLVMFAFGLILVSYVLIWTGYVYFFPYFQNIWPFLTFLIGPSLYFYLKDSFKEEYGRKEIWLHYSTPLLSGLLCLPTFLSDFGIKTGVSADFFIMGTSPILLNGHLLFYTMLIFAMTKNEWQVDANIKTWTKIIAWGMVAYTAAFMSYFVLVRCSFFNPGWDYAISFIMGLGILAVAYMGLLQKRIFRSEPIGNFLPVKKYQTSNLTESASLSIKKNMERLLQEERVFKENELRLADLAAYLDISYHQLSQVINEHYGMNFFEFINKYRVTYVKDLLANPAYDHYTIIQIAYEAGFNNKASFNRYFKKEIGITPSAYRIKEHAER